MPEQSDQRRFRVNERPLSLNWESHGDALTHYLWDELSRGDPKRGTGPKPQTEEFVSSLEFQETDEGTVIYFATREIGDLIDLAAPHLEALIRALDRLIEEQPLHDWWAVIGPSANQLNGLQYLAEEATYGGMRFRQSRAPFTEVRESFPPHLGGWTTYEYFPVVVEGCSHGFDWGAAAEAGVSELNTLCALLSLHLDTYWRIRHTPRARSSEVDPSHLPRQMVGVDLAGMGSGQGSKQEFLFPTWVTSALDVVAADDVVTRALWSHYEGLALEEEHPSYAVIAYVGCVEALGVKSVPVERCGSCVQVTSSGKRFRQALKPVRSSKQRDWLARTYEHRSRTAHEGHLFGDEMMRGGFPYPRRFARVQAGLHFRYQTVSDLRKASHDLLLHHLTQHSETTPR